MRIRVVVVLAMLAGLVAPVLRAQAASPTDPPAPPPCSAADRGGLLHPGRFRSPGDDALTSTLTRGGLDVTWGHVHYDQVTGLIWVATQTGGFWVLELAPQVRAHLDLPELPAYHPGGTTLRPEASRVAVQALDTAGIYCTVAPVQSLLGAVAGTERELPPPERLAPVWRGETSRVFADSTVGMGDVSVFLLVPLGLFLVLALCTWLVMAALQYVWDAATFCLWRATRPEPVETAETVVTESLLAPEVAEPAAFPPPINWRWAR